MDSFRKDSGIESSEWFMQAAAEVEDKSHIPIPVKRDIENGFFTRDLILEVHDLKGDFNPTRRVVRLNYFRMQTCWLLAAISAVVNKRAFSELAVPYLMCVTVLVVKGWKVFAG
jgi:hypothetical protein